MNNLPAPLAWLQIKHESMYQEVIAEDCYGISGDIVKGKDVIDVGANVGAFSLFASQQGANKVLAFEPVLSTYNVLCENILYAGTNNITAYKLAVLDGNKDVDIYLQSDTGHTGLYKASESVEVVQCVSIGEVLSWVDSDDIFLKIDCEGAEYDILLNATKEQMKKCLV